MATSVVYKNSRPQLAIHLLYTRRDGNCCETTFYKIESYFRLSRDDINRIRAAYLIGGGQEWSVNSQHDGLEDPTEYDMVKPVLIDNNGNIITTQPKHPYTGEFMKPKEVPYYSYIIEDMVDSSD